MRTFAALFSVLTATALISPMAMAKGVSMKAHARHAVSKSAGQEAGRKARPKTAEKKTEKTPLAPSKVAPKTLGKNAKRELPPRGPKGQFLPRAKA